MSNPHDPHHLNHALITEFRANQGKLSGRFAHTRLLLLTPTGAKTGLQRTTPLGYTIDGDRLVVLAAKGGAPTHPDWYHNLVAHPAAVVEVGSERFHARVEIPSGQERERLYQQLTTALPFVAEFQRKTSRAIPVVVLERAR
jgi:deazaflavin-dependent oxidoreductase (nitroreductase family)